ncbi:MAG: response regulator transcription factor [Taibaiella sp.]|nr:response regulator transcription factor [Taibaiella sp.]
MNRPLILVIDDDIQIRRLLEITLRASGYEVEMAATGREGISIAASIKPDLVLLDLGLPDKSGQEVLREIREWFANPILVLSVLTGEEEIVDALDNGANDYLTKPYRTGELLARVRSLLKRAQPVGNLPSITSGNLNIDLVAKVVKNNGEVLKLTATEYALLVLFARNEGRVLTHQYLLKEIWGPGFLNQSQYLRVYVAQLRKKIEKDPNRPEIIVTESRVGYRFTEGR